ncbi:hypothetical protein GE09DRAFT_383598 [Coniochaeta sp. 2T2.1]|nr:hypothetical protein GE09DRAFT_383598 [Coniochaeta sp. 2T2.1]
MALLGRHVDLSTTGAPPPPPSNFTFGGNYTAGGDGNFTSGWNTTIWGPIPNDTRRSLQPDIIACALITWVIGMTLVVLRVYTRTRIVKVFGPSDWCVAFAALCAAGVTASAIEQAIRGAGKHTWHMNPYQIPLMTRAAWYGILFYSLSLTFTKISILLLYKRIFTYPGWIKRTIKIVLFVVMAIGVWLIASVCTACVPLEAFWNWWIVFVRPTYCQPPNLWWANAGLHISTDVVIVLLPMPVLSTLRLPRRQKLAVMGVFALGFFVILVSVMRLVKLVEVETTPQVDTGYSGASLHFWTAVEVNTAISCACLMTLKPFVAQFYPGFLAPGSYMTDPTLRHVTARSGRSSGTGRSSRRSFARPGSGMRQGHTMSETQSPRTGMFPHSEEHEMAMCEEAMKTDIEAQRDESVVSTVPEDESTCGAGDLRPPPKPHVRPAT